MVTDRPRAGAAVADDDLGRRQHAARRTRRSRPPSTRRSASRSPSSARCAGMPTGYGMHGEKAADNLSRDVVLRRGLAGLLRHVLPADQPGDRAERRHVCASSSRTGPRSCARRAAARPVAPDRLRRRHPRARQPVVRHGSHLHLRRRRRARDVLRSADSSAAATNRPAPPRLSTDWFLAEGATGGFFTTFVLLSNPNADAGARDDDLPARRRRHRRPPEDPGAATRA